ncbi:Homoserine O-acetyltransferase [Caenispirillum salinarum AK4]|uniref:Probable acyltransferase n=1 Tax=Caenispirillum salinarum AK4 TaxID=1238182 RepID=K9GPP1_9PROT|nr:homoserine O-acetyltransferase [Caenispirillum salinarum]EKV27082.1 Homoserine O-acetyltransferase [Caenispirillum salinarum AK4]
MAFTLSRLAASTAVAVGLLAAGPAAAYDELVEKQVFDMPEYTTAGGETIAPVKVGWEAYGTLNEAKDNAILITHFFSGTGHAAGKYAADDAAPGYWDSIIGPGKPIDTDRYYVISSDTLVNLNTGDPNVTTTGPASINPETGEPWGMDFPVVTIRDFVNVQKALVESLGIERLHAVMGASMGSLQAYEWASAYPDMVERVIPVIGSGASDAYLIGWLNAWAAPIRLDPNWQGGDYYGGTPPTAGLAEALKLVTLQANHWEWADDTFGRAWADASADPARSMEAQYQVEAVLDQVAAARAAKSDANHFLYLVKANQTFLTGHGGSLADGLAAIEAPALVIHAPEDLIFFPEKVRETATLIGADGTPVDIVELQGTRGHLDGVIGIAQAGEAIRAFLAEKVSGTAPD